MSESDPAESRLREELQAIDGPPVDVERLLAAGRRRARRRSVRRGAAVGASIAGVAAAAVAVVVLPHDPSDTVTDTRTPTTSPTAPTTTRPADVVVRGDGTTWPGGPFDPIDGMVPVPGGTLLSDDEAATIVEAEQRLISVCMAQQGFQWGAPAPGEPVGSPPSYLSPDELRAGGFDYEYDWAAAGEEFLGNSDGGGDASYTAGMTAEELAAYEAALIGTSPEPDVEINTHDGTSATSSEGCVGEARAQLYGSVANSLRYSNLVEPFSNTSGQLRRHEAYQRPLADWQACMLQAGFDVGDHDYGASYIQQQGAVALSRHGRDQTQFTAETIPAIAEADADCQESSGLYEVRQALLAEIPTEIAADLGVAFDHYVAYEHALYERAQQIP